MKQSRATIRYAKALLQISTEKNYLEQSYKDMVILDNACSESKELSLLLKSPIVKTDQKLKIFNKMFSAKVSENSMMFINLILSKKRELLLAGISKSFISLYKLKNKIQTATITTTTPLTEQLKNNIVKYIKNKTNSSKIELRENLDKNLIGGVIIRMGDKQLDASISSEITELRQIFNNNLYIQDL